MKKISQMEVRIQTVWVLVLAVFLVTSPFANPAHSGEINAGYFRNVAIEGYDTVSYFTEGKAVKGSKDYAMKWLGATWRFSSAENQNLFKLNPVRYAPQYGGYCADGVADGVTKANIDPNAWRIIDGKLYLNYDEESAAALEETPGRIEKADENWENELRAKVKSR